MNFTYVAKAAKNQSAETSETVDIPDEEETAEPADAAAEEVATEDVAEVTAEEAEEASAEQAEIELSLADGQDESTEAEVADEEEVTTSAEGEPEAETEDIAEETSESLDIEEDAAQQAPPARPGLKLPRGKAKRGKRGKLPAKGSVIPISKKKKTTTRVGPAVVAAPRPIEPPRVVEAPAPKVVAAPAPKVVDKRANNPKVETQKAKS